MSTNKLNELDVQDGKTFVGVEFPNDILGTIEGIRVMEDRSRSSMIRTLVNEALNARGKNSGSE